MSIHISRSDWKVSVFSAFCVAVPVWLEWRHLESIPMTQDSISLQVESVVGLMVVASAVLMLLVSLALFLSRFRRLRGWTWRVTFGGALRAGLRLGGRNALAAMCLLISSGVLWQRWAGEVHLTPGFAALMIAGIGGLAALVAAASAHRALERFLLRAVPCHMPAVR